MKFIGRHVEFIVSIAFLWVCEGLFWSPIQYFSQKAQPLDATDPISTAIHALFLGLLIVVCAVRRERMMAAFRAGWPIMVLIAFAFLSAFWTDAPELVLRRVLTLLVTTVFAMFLVVRFEMPQLVSMLLFMNVAGVIASFAVMLIAPKLALGASMDYPNAVRGAYSSKNTLGGLSALGLLVAGYALWRGYGSRLVALAVIPANFALLYVSQSATALILTMAGAYAAIVAGAYRQRNAFGFAVGFILTLVGVAGVALLLLSFSEVLGLLGRSSTLTGRWQIWVMSTADIGHRPWLGFGYGAFWRHDTIEARNMWTKLFWTVPHAHNAWLEVGLALGIPGMVGMTMLWVIGIYRGVRLLVWPSAHHVAFCLALFMAILVENLTEYEFFRADSIFWVLFVVGFVYLGREAASRSQVLATRPRHLGAQPAAPEVPLPQGGLARSG